MTAKPKVITLAGCGFLGGLFAVELAKRMFALELLPQSMRLIDFDTVEDRNTANQVFGKVSVGAPKADALRNILQYEQEVMCDPVPLKLDEKNADALLEDSVVIVDAFDNLEARNVIWYWAKKNNIPVLHLGVSQEGSGYVEWSAGEYESWSLSPIALLGRKLPPTDPAVLPPCELITFRALGLNMAVAGAKAFSIWAGFDPEHTLDTKLRQGMKLDDYGILTDWMADNFGHRLLTVAPDAARWEGAVPLANEDTDGEEEETEAKAVEVITEGAQDVGR